MSSASGYEDYVLLFIKYVRDRYAGQPYAPYMLAAGFALKPGIKRETYDVNPKG